MIERTVTPPLKGVSRIDIFRHLAVDEEDNHINEPLLAGISDEYYSEFIELCEAVSKDPSQVKSLSVCTDDDGNMRFSVEFE